MAFMSKYKYCLSFLNVFPVCVHIDLHINVLKYDVWRQFSNLFEITDITVMYMLHNMKLIVFIFTNIICKCIFSVFYR